MLAGLLGGLAAWTKDEGLLFVAVFLTTTAIFRRQQLLRLLAGAALGGVVAIFFKTILARGDASLSKRQSAPLGATPF